MRIAHVISDYLPESWGGTQLHVQDLCAGLRARGHDVAVFAGTRDASAEQYAVTEGDWDGVAVTRVNNDFRDLDRFDLLSSNPRIDARFASFLNRFAPDLVHVHHLSGLSCNVIDVAERTGIPCVLTVHDWWLLCPRGQRIHPETLEVCDPIDRGVCLPCLSALWPHLLATEGTSTYRLRRWEQRVRETMDRCRLLIAPSHFHRERLVEQGLDPERCVAVPHGLPRGGPAPRPPRGGRPRDIGFIGTVLPSKGVHVLVDAFLALGDPDLRLHVHGAIPDYHGDSSYGDRLRAQAGAHAITLHGSYERGDLPEILAALDVLVVPSIWWESFCLTLREGVLAGVPVVASDFGAMAEAVEQGLALGFEPGNAGDLALVLRRLLDDAALREEMGARAHLVRTIADCVTETERLYGASILP